MSSTLRNTLPASTKPTIAEDAAKRNARLGVQHDQPVAAFRKAVEVDRLRRAEPIEREAANGRIAAGIEPLARRQIVDDGRLAVARHGTRKSRGQTDARAERDDGRARPGSCRKANPCRKVLKKPTCDPMRRAASSASAPIRLPLVGSIGSLRVSRISETTRSRGAPAETGDRSPAASRSST